MRKSLLFLFVSFFSLYGFCQDFGTSDSEWVYNYSGGFIAGVTKISFEKDTLIGNRQCTKFIISYDRALGTSLPPKQVFFHKNKKFIEFSFRGIDFDILFNFGAAVGSNWKVYRRSHINNMLIDSVQVRVDSISKTRINGKDLLTQKVTYSGITRNFNYVDVIYESIGPKFDYLFPWDREERQRDGGEGGAVRCFYNSELGLVELDTTRFINRFPYDCDQLVSVEENLIPTFQLEIYPNPVVDRLHIESRQSSELKMELSDLLGRVLQQVKIYPGENSIDLSTYPPGHYVLKAGGRVIHRVIKE